MTARSAGSTEAAVAAGRENIRWQSVATAAMVLLIWLAVSALFWPTVQSLIVEWRNTDNLTYTHGYLIAAIAGWLILRSVSWSRMPNEPDWRLLPGLVILSLCWLIAFRAGLELVHQVLFPLLGLTAVCANLGLRSGMRFWFAFAFLYFAIPVWTVGNEVLQSGTVVAVQLLLRLTSVPAYVNGNIVNIPAGAFEIAGGCSGLHFFIVALALAALYGEVYRDSLKARVRLMLIAAVLAVITNWLRVYVIILAGHLTDMQHYLVRISHYYFGWAVFAVTMIVFFLLASRMPVRSAGSDASSSAPGKSAAKSGVLALGVVASALSIGPVWNALLPVADARDNAGDLLPPISRNWNGPYNATDKWQPAYPDSDRSERSEYRSDGKAVTVFVAEYDSQRQGKELIGFANSLTSGLNGEVTPLPAVAGSHGLIGRLQITEADGSASTVLYHYQIGPYRLVNGFAAQVRYGLASLYSAPVSRVLAVRAACDLDCETASADARQLLDALDSVVLAAADPQ